MLAPTLKCNQVRSEMPNYGHHLVHGCSQQPHSCGCSQHCSPYQFHIGILCHMALHYELFIKSKPLFTLEIALFWLLFYSNDQHEVQKKQLKWKKKITIKHTSDHDQLHCKNYTKWQVTFCWYQATTLSIIQTATSMLKQSNSICITLLNLHYKNSYRLLAGDNFSFVEKNKETLQQVAKITRSVIYILPKFNWV